jgi:pimeloyl-ACP methyl ester carboxylesterase
VVELLFLLLPALQESALERYLREPDPRTRAAIRADLRMSLAEAERAIRENVPAFPESAAPGTTVRRKTVADHPRAVPFEYLLRIPARYTPARRWPILVVLHGQGGTADDSLRRWLPEAARLEDWFVLAPMAGRGGWGRSLLGHAYVFTALREAARSFAIDPDRVFLDGASMGGNGAFQLACAYPDRFAAVCARSGGPAFRRAAPGPEAPVEAEGLENLLATPVYWIVGARDPKLPYAWVKQARARLEELGAPLVYREYPEGGHEAFPQQNGAVLDWMSARRRDAYPLRVGLATSERLFNRAFWLEIEAFREPERVERRFTDFEGDVLETRRALAGEVRVRAELRRDANEIRVTASGARELRIYLHERMVDFDRPLGVTANGTRSTFTARPSLETLLESARRDRGLLYTAVVSVRIP